MVLDCNTPLGNILQSSATSLSDLFLQACCNKCDPNSCDCCLCVCIKSVLADRSHTVLRKICRKIIKDDNRQKCRQRYTIFDGGNSIGMSVHRSLCQIDEKDAENEAKANEYEKMNDEKAERFVKSQSFDSVVLPVVNCNCPAKTKGARCDPDDAEKIKQKCAKHQLKTCKEIMDEESSKKLKIGKRNGRHKRKVHRRHTTDSLSAKIVVFEDEDKNTKDKKSHGLKDKSSKNCDLSKSSNLGRTCSDANKSRFDHNNASDLLRAKMEERDLCKSACQVSKFQCLPNPSCTDGLPCNVSVSSWGVL